MRIEFGVYTETTGRRRMVTCGYVHAATRKAAVLLLQDRFKAERPRAEDPGDGSINIVYQDG